MIDIRKSLPDVSGIDIPFYWLPVQVALDMPAADYNGETLRDEYNAEDKRNDGDGFEDLRDSIVEDGWLDPVSVDVPDETGKGNGRWYQFTKYVAPDWDRRALGNGHHRVLAALDLGYTHIPATADPVQAWRRSGPQAW